MNTPKQNIYKNFIGKAESFNETERTIVSIITTNSVDRYNEIVQPDGIQLTNYQKNPVVLLNHNQNTLPIGKNIWIKKDANGLIAQTQFAKTSLGEDVMNLYKDGFMNAFSIGFIPLRYEFDSQDRIVFTQSELLEYSCVSVPANQDALALALKSVKTPELKDRLNEWNKSIELEKRINELFETSKGINDLQIQYLELKMKLADLQSQDSEFNQAKELIEKQNQTIDEMKLQISRITTKENQRSRHKSLESMITKVLNQKIGIE